MDIRAYVAGYYSLGRNMKKNQSFDEGIQAMKEIPLKATETMAFWIFRIGARCAIMKYKALEREKLKLAQLVLI